MGKFTQRHYEAIASVLDQLGNRPSHCEVVSAFAEMFALDNPRFKASMFFFAAGEPEVAAEIKAQLAQISSIKTKAR